MRRFRLGKTPLQVDSALRELIRDAWNHVPSIRRRFEQARVDPAMIRTARDLVHLPISDRASFDLGNLQNHLRRGTDVSRCHTCVTSGTTGQHFTIYMNRAEAFFRRLVLFRAIRKNVRVTIPFSIVAIGTDIRTNRDTRWYDAYRVTRISGLLPIDEQVETVIRASPDVLTGMPSCLELVAERMLERQAQIEPLIVVSRGENLRSTARSLMSEAFGCRVVDYYNCEEVGNIAWECPHDPETLHVQTDACILEIVDADGHSVGPGVVGKVVVTSLFNHTMPFIRHDLGDRAAIKPPVRGACSCGYSGPSLSPIDGRDDDFFWRTDGQRISPRAIVMMLRETMLRLEQRIGQRVGRYQVIQEATGQIRVLLATQSPIPEDSILEIADIMERLGLGAECAVARVNSISSEPSGKFRRFVSRMGSG